MQAKRELLEETGYVSGNWELLLEDEPVSKMDWKVYTYIARNCVYEQEQQLDGGEKIDVNLVSFDDLVALADNPEFHGRSIKEILLRAVYSEQEREKLSARIFGV